MRRLEISQGILFGRLTVIKEALPRKYKSRSVRRFLCMCTCGQKVGVDLPHLRSGHTQSCGCLQIESVTTHGETYNPLYRVLQGMLSRCYSPSHTSYWMYGEKGISVCKEWRNKSNGLENFLSWNASLPEEERFKEGLQIDRWPNQQGNYEPTNCRWVTPTQNNRNRKDNVRISYQGAQIAFADFWDQYGHPSVSYDCAKKRLLNMNWPALKAVTQPTRETR